MPKTISENPQTPLKFATNTRGTLDFAAYFYGCLDRLAFYGCLDLLARSGGGF